MKTWTKILPFFVVEYIAKKHLERFVFPNGNRELRVVNPYKGVYIEL